MPLTKTKRILATYALVAAAVAPLPGCMSTEDFQEAAATEGNRVIKSGMRTTGSAVSGAINKEVRGFVNDLF